MFKKNRPWFAQFTYESSFSFYYLLYLYIYIYYYYLSVALISYTLRIVGPGWGCSKCGMTPTCKLYFVSSNIRKVNYILIGQEGRYVKVQSASDCSMAAVQGSNPSSLSAENTSRKAGALCSNVRHSGNHKKYYLRLDVSRRHS